VNIEAVREAFHEEPRGGSALTVIEHGEVVLEVHEGWRDAARTVPWDEDTLVNVWSVGKPVIALALVLLAQRGLVTLEDPVARHWPEFRSGATLRDVLTHTAGLPAFPVPRPVEAWSDWDLLCADLAAATPEWPPGTVPAEHAFTYGHLIGEVVRRVDGRSPARFVAEEIARPYAADLGFGLGAADIARCAELEFGSYQRKPHQAPFIGNPAGSDDVAVLNGDMWRAASIPAINLHATATAMARFYQGLMTGPAGEVMAEPRVEGEDRFVGSQVVWGLGVQIEPDQTWGMGGLGGSAAWADPVNGRAIGYVTRRMGDFSTVDRIEEALRKFSSTGRG
jgi:CubicO group peptidase (beta-lactamase class C family)